MTKPINNSNCVCQFWIGFDAAIDMVINLLDEKDSNELALFSVWAFIEKFKSDLINKVDYIKNGNKVV